MNKGRFFVIEGTDGSGKKTQSDLLIARLKKIGRVVQTFDFPQYKNESSILVRRYLQGIYGELDEVGPKQASILYAVDRFDASRAIRSAQEADKMLISNRYVGSNLGHQGSKFDTPAERKEFFNWVLELEYGILKIPEPDLNIILHVPAEVAQRLASEKNRSVHVNTENGEEEVRDIHEDNLEHLQKSEQVYQEIARIFPEKFCLIECAPEGKLLPKSEIHTKIWELVKDLI